MSRIIQKKYRDGSYPDQPPIGQCIICGCDIEPGEPFFRCDEGLIHGAGSIGSVATRELGNVSVSCFLAYLSESCAEDEAARAMGIERVVEL